MGRACSTYGVEERCIQGFGGNLRERGHLGDLGVHGRVILKWFFKRFLVGVLDMVDKAVDRHTWWAILKAVTNIQVA